MKDMDRYMFNIYQPIYMKDMGRVYVQYIQSVYESFIYMDMYIICTTNIHQYTRPCRATNYNHPYTPCTDHGYVHILDVHVRL